MNVMKLQIISPDRVLYQGECTMVEYNTTEGYVGVLPGHIAMTQVVAPGKLCIYETKDAKPKVASLMSGFVQIMPDLVTIMAQVIEWADEIDVERAKEAKERAEQHLREEKVDFARANAALQRAVVRIDVAKSN